MITFIFLYFSYLSYLKINVMCTITYIFFIFFTVISNITTNIQTPSSNKLAYHGGNNQNVTTTSSYGYQQTRVQSTSNIYIDSPLSHNAKDKRKERKIYLDKRKSNHMSTIPIGISYISSYFFYFIHL